jgi:hypothetical protein
MKIILVILMLALPQAMQASEISGSISTKYDRKNSALLIVKSQEKVIEVKGVSYYADGTLLRYNKKIYIIENQTRRHIRNLKELREYSGQGIFDVDGKTMEQYELKIFKDGSLIRGSDMRVYIVVGNTKKHIINLEELREFYFGIEIFNVSDDVIERYVVVG